MKKQPPVQTAQNTDCQVSKQSYKLLKTQIHLSVWLFVYCVLKCLSGIWILCFVTFIQLFPDWLVQALPKSGRDSPQISSVSCATTL